MPGLGVKTNKYHTQPDHVGRGFGEVRATDAGLRETPKKIARLRISVSRRTVPPTCARPGPWRGRIGADRRKVSGP